MSVHFALHYYTSPPLPASLRIVLRFRFVRHIPFMALLSVMFALSACSSSPVLTGIDVLARDDFQPIAEQRIALITNHTGIARNGQSTIQLLHNAPNVELVRIFSPEHGIAGTLDIENIAHGVDTLTRIPVFSLYGETRGPTTDMLAGIDTVVFDIQDIGTRFYTYISTMAKAMQAAADHDVRFVVLDRPNPINGVDVSGPVIDEGKESFVGIHRIPVRHGMTVGELARLFNAELGIGVDLQVIELRGWKRDTYFDATGLRWVNPSPNMRSLTQALLYPGIGLLETTNLSVGRGTETPFEIIGAPWLDGVELASQLNRAELPGIRFLATEFTPDASKFENELCRGVRFRITDRSRFDPSRTGFEIARQLALSYGDLWESDRYLRLLGNERTLQAIRTGTPYVGILAI
ncbi:MAG: DUF1343 domain-containing protein, partial [Woeseia sp.]